MKAGDVVLDGDDVTYVLRNLDSWDGGCCLEGISLVEGIITTDWYAAFDTIKVLA